MVLHYLKVALRNLLKYKTHSFISALFAWQWESYAIPLYAFSCRNGPNLKTYLTASDG